MMKMITNLWKPTTGDIEIFGEILTPKSYAVQKKIGSMIEFPTFYEHMTGMENLQLHCKYTGYSKFENIEKALQLLDMTQAADMFIALLIGLKMKSTKATIITSVILVCVTQGNIGTYTLKDNVGFYIVLLVLAVASVFLTIYNAETKDVM